MHPVTHKILLIPEKTDIERDKVADAYQRLGGSVVRLGKFWHKTPELEGKQVCIYGNDTFARVTAQVFNVSLLSPDDALIARLSVTWTKREILLKSIGQLKESDFPCFGKPVIPKQFSAQVYETLNAFMSATQGLDVHTQILLSAVIDIRAEARGFVWNGTLMDLAVYEGSANLERGKAFLTDFIISRPPLPGVYVVDIGYHESKGWFILEFNACWGAGLNGCNPEMVIKCITEATQN